MMAKAVKGDISSLSQWPYGMVVALRGQEEGKLRRLHGPNNVIIVSFKDAGQLCRQYGIGR